MSRFQQTGIDDFGSNHPPQNTRVLTDAMSKDAPKAGIIILNLALYIVYTFGLKPKLVGFISMQ